MSQQPGPTRPTHPDRPVSVPEDALFGGTSRRVLERFTVSLLERLGWNDTGDEIRVLSAVEESLDAHGYRIAERPQ